MGQPGAPTAAMVAAGIPPGMQQGPGGVPVSTGVPMATSGIVAGSGVPISVGPLPAMQMPAMPAINVAPGGVPHNQAMAAGGRGAGLSPAPAALGGRTILRRALRRCNGPMHMHPCTLCTRAECPRNSAWLCRWRTPAWHRMCAPPPCMHERPRARDAASAGHSMHACHAVWPGHDAHAGVQAPPASAAGRPRGWPRGQRPQRCGWWQPRRA